MKPKKNKAQRKASSGEDAKEIGSGHAVRANDNRRATNDLLLKKPGKNNAVSNASSAGTVGSEARTEPSSQVSVCQVTDTALNELTRFTKRKIVSNWSRYERTLSDESEEERQVHDVTTEPTRGTDFTEALNASKSVGGQFRFRDEQDWDDPTSADDDVEAQFGTLDVDDLAASMSCIPLHTRLNIDDSYFLPELLKQFEIEAQTQRATYDSKRQSKVEEETADEIVISNDAKSSLSTDTRLEDELDALLNLGPSFSSMASLITIPDAAVVTDTERIAENSAPSTADKDTESNRGTVTETTQSLEHWLDSVILD